MTRPIENWIGILTGKTPDQIAKQILGDLTHYRNGGNYESDDRAQIINVLEAWRQIHAAKQET